MTHDHDPYREWLHLEADGGLSSAERSRLRGHLESCARCREEHAAVGVLLRTLDAGRVEPRPDLAHAVMTALPPAGWEARHPRSWRVAALLLALVAGAAALLVTGGESPAGAPALAALATVGELFRSTLVAGAGMLTASWSGLGMALKGALGDSTAAYVAFGALVVGLDLLFWRFLTRSMRRARQATGNPDSASRR